MINEILKSKIRKHVKKLKNKHEKFSINEAFKRIRAQIKMEEALTEEEMPEIENDIWARLKENWPFKDKI